MKIKFTVFGNPVTKKNSQEIIQVDRGGGGKRPIPIQSKQYQQYRRDFLMQIPGSARLNIDTPINLKCVYYMATRRPVDITNLYSATNDLLVDGNVLMDDCRDVVASTDGSIVLLDRENPRVEITITDYTGDYEQWQKQIKKRRKQANIWG